VLKHVPLILIAREPLHVRSAHRRGVRECVARPASPPSFIAAIERQCQRRRRSPAMALPVIDARAAAVRRTRAERSNENASALDLAHLDPIVPASPSPAAPFPQACPVGRPIPTEVALEDLLNLAP